MSKQAENLRKNTDEAFAMVMLRFKDLSKSIQEYMQVSQMEIGQLRELMDIQRKATEKTTQKTPAEKASKKKKAKK